MAGFKRKVGISGVKSSFKRVSSEEEGKSSLGKRIGKIKLRVSVEGIKFCFAEIHYYVLSAAADALMLGHLNRRLSA